MTVKNISILCACILSLAGTMYVDMLVIHAICKELGVIPAILYVMMQQ